jgi:hypothetical protein
VLLASLLAVTLSVLAPAGADAPAAVPDAPEAREVPEAGPIASIVVDSASVDADLLAEIELRLTGRRVVDTGKLEAIPEGRFAWIGIEWQADDRVLARIVLDDGRAYSRGVTAPPHQLRRAIAGAVTNLLDGIEHDLVAPEAHGVPVPLPELTRRPAIVATPPTTPRAIEPTPAPPPAAVPPPRWHLGPFVGGGAVFGLGPPTDLDGYAGAGGTIGLDAVHRSGAIASIEARALTHARDPLRMIRVRVAIAGGWALRRRAFELLVRAGATIEPVILRESGSRAAFEGPGGGATRPAPLVGLIAGISPTYVLWSRDRSVALRLALDVELAASMEASPRPGAIRTVEERADTVTGLLRAGGLELGAGVRVGAWFAVPRR